MKIFLGSSRESLNHLRHVASWLEEEGHEPLAWDDPELFLPGESTFAKLIAIAKDVQAAVFVFGEDDAVWYRLDALSQPRDNVLVEYGLFSGALGQRNVIVCRVGSSKLPTDTGGITYVGLDLAVRARLSVLAWVRNISSASSGDRDAPLVIERAMMRRELDETRNRLVFEEQKARDLQQLATRAGIIDFDSYGGVEGPWKLLFDYAYFWDLADLLGSFAAEPYDFRDHLVELGLDRPVASVNWSQGTDPGRKLGYIAKVLRLMRSASMSDGAAELDTLLNSDASWRGLRERAAKLAATRSAAITDNSLRGAPAGRTRR